MDEFDPSLNGGKVYCLEHERDVLLSCLLSDEGFLFEPRTHLLALLL